MIGIKEAVKIARSFLVDAFSEEAPANLLLEEVNRTEDERYWLITLGFSRPAIPTNQLQAALLGSTLQRVYKVIKIDAETGTPLGIQMRD